MLKRQAAVAAAQFLANHRLPRERERNLKAKATGGGLTLSQRQALRRVARNPRRNADGTDNVPWIDQLPGAMQGEAPLGGPQDAEPRYASDYAGLTFDNPDYLAQFISTYGTKKPGRRWRGVRAGGGPRPKKQKRKKRAKNRQAKHSKRAKRCTCGAKSGRVIQLNL